MGRWPAHTFRRLNATPAKQTELSIYAGKFRNDELGIVWNLMIANGKLFIITSAGWRIPLDRVAEDCLKLALGFLSSIATTPASGASGSTVSEYGT